VNYIITKKKQKKTKTEIGFLFIKLTYLHMLYLYINLLFYRCLIKTITDHYKFYYKYKRLVIKIY